MNVVGMASIARPLIRHQGSSHTTARIDGAGCAPPPPRSSGLNTTFPNRLPRASRQIAKAEADVASKVTGQRMRYPQPPRLNDPANIGSCCEGQANVTDAGPGPGHLENYMRLPVEQYAVLDGANISRLGPNLFKLVVPRLEFFDVWIEPELEVTVELHEQPGNAPKVVMKAQKCRISGSDFVEQFDINNKFDMNFRAELKWKGSTKAGGGPARLMCKTGLEVYCEVTPPFNILPRATLEGGCNSVLSTFMPMIMRLFLSKLADDYSRWSTDAAFREARSATSNEPVVLQGSIRQG